MIYEDLAVVILAAGKGTRMKSDLAKVLHKVAGKSMVVHVIDTAKKVSDNHIHVVVGHQADAVKKEISNYHSVNYSYQENLLGTGDAVKSAMPDIDKDIKNIMVLCGDVPLIQEDTLRILIEGHENQNAKVSVLATDLEEPKGYGRLILDDSGGLLSIVEEADANPEQKEIKKINTGIYCFDKDVLLSAIELIQPDNNQDEYYLTDVIGIATRNNDKSIAVTMDDPRQVIGVNTLEELERASRLIAELDR